MSNTEPMPLPLSINTPTRVQVGRFNCEGLTGDEDTEAFSLLGSHGYTPAGYLGEGLFSKVYLARSEKPNFPHVAAKVSNDLVMTGPNSEDPRTVASGEYNRLALMYGIQIRAGLNNNTCYTPVPVDIIRNDRRVIEVMEAIPGVQLNDVITGNASLTERQIVSAMVQTLHLFSILESNDSTDGIILGMGRDMHARNIIVDAEGEAVRTKLIDWSIGIRRDQLQEARENERFRIAQYVGASLLGQPIHNIDRVDARKEGMGKVLRGIDAMMASGNWESLNPAIKHFYLKGLGVLKDHPNGYPSHKEMLTDVLKVCKAIGITREGLPELLRGQYDEITPLLPGELEDYTLIEGERRKPLDREISARLDMIYRFGRNTLKENTPADILNNSLNIDGYTPDEVLNFLANCTEKNFSFLERDQAQMRVLMAKYLAGDYLFLNRIAKHLSNNITSTRYLEQRKAWLDEALPSIEEQYKIITVNQLKSLLQGATNYWTESINIHGEQGTDLVDTDDPEIELLKRVIEDSQKRLSS